MGDESTVAVQDTATTETYTEENVGSVRCVKEEGAWQIYPVSLNGTPCPFTNAAIPACPGRSSISAEDAARCGFGAKSPRGTRDDDTRTTYVLDLLTSLFLGEFLRKNGCVARLSKHIKEFGRE